MTNGTSRAQLVLDLRLKCFTENQTFENARSLFLACKKYKTEIPEDVLDVITKRFEYDHEKYFNEELESKEIRKKRLEKLKQKAFELDCFIESATQQEAVDKYIEKTGEKIEFHALRKRAERYLQELFPEEAEASLAELLECYKYAEKESAFHKTPSPQTPL